MTVSLDVGNDMRAMDADGVARAEIARRLHVSRNAVARYADMEDMSPAAPLPAPRRRPALEGHEAWDSAALEADLDGWMRWFREGRISQALGWLTPDEHRLALGYAV